jgi:hypothetical protein
MDLFFVSAVIDWTQKIEIFISAAYVSRHENQFSKIKKLQVQI